MKTMLFSLLIAISFHSLVAQNELASIGGVPPHRSSAAGGESKSAEPAIVADSYTVDDQMIINLGRGFSKTLQVQVLTPASTLLFDKEIPAGQKSVRVDLAGLPDGIYMLRIKLGNKVWVKQVVKG